MTEAEKRYAQLEKELLAIVWTCERLSRYLVGMDTFRIITDHKPLVLIINDKDLDVVPVCCNSNSNSNVFYIQALVPLKQCSSAPYFSTPTIHRNKRLYHSDVQDY